jgi:hypothetical protein
MSRYDRMLVISQNITSTMMSSVRTSPYIAPRTRGARRRRGRRPRLAVEIPAAVEQDERSTPVTMSVSTQPRVSIRIEVDAELRDPGKDSVGTRPAMISGVARAACTNATTGSRAATKNARGPMRPTSHGSASGITANAARSTSNLAS